MIVLSVQWVCKLTCGRHRICDIVSRLSGFNQHILSLHFPMPWKGMAHFQIREKLYLSEHTKPL